MLIVGRDFISNESDFFLIFEDRLKLLKNNEKE